MPYLWQMSFIFNISDKLWIYSMCMGGFVCVHICTYCEFLVPSEARRACQISLGLELQDGCEPASPGRASGALKHQDMSPAPIF